MLIRTQINKTKLTLEIFRSGGMRLNENKFIYHINPFQEFSRNDFRNGQIPKRYRSYLYLVCPLFFCLQDRVLNNHHLIFPRRNSSNCSFTMFARKHLLSRLSRFPSNRRFASSSPSQSSYQVVVVGMLFTITLRLQMIFVKS